MFADEPRADKPVSLEDMSVDDLRQRIEDLKAEIVRTEGELTKKEAHKSASDALFGKGD